MKKRDKEDLDTPDPTFGFGNENCEPEETPARMRDCVKEILWESPPDGDLYYKTLYLALDFRRRFYSKDIASKKIYERLTHLLKRDPNTDEQRTIRNALEFAFTSNTKLMTCSDTGALVRRGYCFRKQRQCHYWEEERTIRTLKIDKFSTPLTTEWIAFLDNHIREGGFYSKWIYLELLKLEYERGLVPGDAKNPIFIGFRELESRIKKPGQTNHFTKYQACLGVNYLIDLGLIKKVVTGKSGRRMREANGYVRTKPLPPVPNDNNG